MGNRDKTREDKQEKGRETTELEGEDRIKE